MLLPPFLASRTAQAQYYNYYTGYNCLTGCGKAYTAATAVSLGLAALDTGLQIHAYSKALEAQTRQYQYQAEINKAIANYPQRMVDYYNILRVAPFFEDDVPKYPMGQNPPQVSSFSKNKTSELNR